MTDENTPRGVPGRNSIDEIVANARREREGGVPSPDAEQPELESGSENQENDNPEGTNPEENEPSREQNSENGNYTGEGENDSSDDKAAREDSGEQDEEDLVAIVVDGEERQVPRDKVYEQGIRALQKESAADKRLAEATEKMRAATEYENRVKQQVEAQLRNQKREENDGEPLSKKQDEEIRAKARRIIDKILDGNEDEAAAALAEAMSGRGDSTPSFDKNTLAQEVTQKVQRDLDAQAGIAALKERYAHIANDTQLWNMADRETIRISQEHPDWKPSRVILEAAKTVDEWVKSVGGGQTKPDTPAPSGKAERKRTMEKLRTAAAKVPGEPEKRPPTRSEVVANMRKNRGLPGY